MQTFLPYPDFKQTAQCLDYRRLGKQRVEAWQIYQTLTGGSFGWRNHPAVKMWRGYEQALLVYGIAICKEWKLRGYKDTMLPKFVAEFNEMIRLDSLNPLYPYWLNDYDFHRSHQSNLLRKDRAYYSHWFPNVTDNLPYVWPEPKRIS